MNRRGHTAEDIVQATNLLQKYGFETGLQMMTGLPSDTEQKSIETARKIIALSPDGVRIYPTVVVRDTELYDLWKAGKYKEHTVEDAVSLCAVIAKMFDEANIPIIRMGLNPTDELSGGAAVAGAYHPALGELIRSRMMRNKALEHLKDIPEGKVLVLGVNRSDISKMTGNHRCNIVYLTEKLGLKSVRVTAADVNKGEIISPSPSPGVPVSSRLASADPLSSI